jgi:hypothetical protein
MRILKFATSAGHAPFAGTLYVNVYVPGFNPSVTQLVVVELKAPDGGAVVSDQVPPAVAPALK